MRAAAAEITRQRFSDLAVGRFGIFIDKGLLNFVHLLGRAQAFERSDRFILHRTHRSDTRADGIAVHDDRAGAALSETAAEFRPIQPEIVAESVEQRHIWLGVDHQRLAVHFEGNSRHSCLLMIMTDEPTPVSYTHLT